MVKEHWNDGTLTLCEPSLVPVLKTLLEEYCPQLIIEFGTYHGGFTKYLANWFAQVPIYTIDIQLLMTKELHDWFIKRGNVSILYASLFSDNLIIPFLLAMPMKKFLLVDNGDKDMELNMYAGYLRPGDLLAVHDWSDEVNLEKCGHTLKEFDPHQMNATFDENLGTSDFRFFYRKHRKFNE